MARRCKCLQLFWGIGFITINTFIYCIKVMVQMLVVLFVVDLVDYLVEKMVTNYDLNHMDN